MHWPNASLGLGPSLGLRVPSDQLVGNCAQAGYVRIADSDLRPPVHHGEVLVVVGIMMPVVEAANLKVEAGMLGPSESPSLA